MSEIIADLVGWIQQQPAWAVYLGILGVAYLENLLPPIPGDLLVVFGGYLASRGQLLFAGVVILATIGGTAGFMTMYEFGKKLGPALLSDKRFRWLPHKRLRRATNWFGRVGNRLILANRFLSGLRSVISITVGIAHTRPLPTLIYSAISSLVWVSLLTYLGFSLGENWELVQNYLNRYGQFMGAAIVLFIGIQLLRYTLSVRQQSLDEDDRQSGGSENLHG